MSEAAVALELEQAASQLQMEDLPETTLGSPVGHTMGSHGHPETPRDIQHSEEQAPDQWRSGNPNQGGAKRDHRPDITTEIREAGGLEEVLGGGGRGGHCPGLSRRRSATAPDESLREDSSTNTAV